MKWADFCISKVKYNNKHSHVDSVLALPDRGKEFGSSKVLSRKEVIKKIKDGESFVTITLGNNGWNRGQILKIVEINGLEYVKTATDSTTSDNLGSLPEF